MEKCPGHLPHLDLTECHCLKGMPPLMFLVV